ncbi:tmRNA-binding protein [Candidatus Hydrogenisulfobacillus filiaventi]|uniref:SsrA-binding protein n=1 Tax=Candidatus Hydrogenisulfobacillus filiaventi TaxID=2707344 RepID=A0A6F8ZIK3_9FIRM|nr:tmRNA-binding protein [Candidatus Hydrogenisulfobacillus filiaventi]
MARTETPVVENRKAHHDYFIEEVLEAGMVLTGTEVKSIRLGRVNLRDSHARVENGEVFLYNCHVAPYEQGNRWNHDPYRVRKLLLHKDEIRRLAEKVRNPGYTLVPLRLYFDRHGRAKVALALARGKKTYDKRESIARREAQRRMEQAMRARR